jgi:NTP pyrophosphatase (non-canonical NTP hydrolase)
MTTNQASKILIEFNRWRRADDDIPQPSPKKVGQAIDKAVSVLLRFETTRPTKKTKQMNQLIEKVLTWGIEKEITGPNGKGTKIAQAAKVLEEARETYSAVQAGDLHETKDGIGDTIVTCILLAEMHGWAAEECLQAAYDVISKRTGEIIDGSFVKSSETENVIYYKFLDENDMDEPLGAACQLGDINCESCS